MLRTLPAPDRLAGQQALSAAHDPRGGGGLGEDLRRPRGKSSRFGREKVLSRDQR